MGAIYDVLRIIRLFESNREYCIFRSLGQHFWPQKHIVKRENKREVPHGILTCFEDIFFCILCALIEILAFYQITDGKIRIYGLLLTGLGFYCYFHTVGKFVILMAKPLIYHVKKMLFYVFCAIFTPFIWIFVKIKGIFHQKGSLNHNDKKEAGD